MIRHFLLALVVVVSTGASAASLTSTAAGFANGFHMNCDGVANPYVVEITVSSYNSCIRHGVIEFTVAGAGVTSVSSATLSLYGGFIGNWSPSLISFDVYGYSADGLVTGDDADAGTYIGTTTWDRIGLPTGPFIIELSAFVNGQLALGTPIIGIGLRASLETTNCCTSTWVDFDGGLGSQPPTLTLQPVPLAPALWLYGGALGALGLLKRRARSVRSFF